ncbi:alpha/beta hydrolase, partial [Streptomyces spongiae]|nr:alpha/beta hydrolase [Streptomyces spongiae]
MRLPWSTAAISLGAAGLLVGAVPAVSAAGPADAPAAHADQRPAWGPCPPAEKELNATGARCADVTVPLDHSAPGGRTIRVKISRIEARDPTHRRGILLSNPGGPGGAGLASTLALRPTLGDVADRYDLIGFDPRFLGESTPLRCDPAPPSPTPP